MNVPTNDIRNDNWEAIMQELCCRRCRVLEADVDTLQDLVIALETQLEEVHRERWERAMREIEAAGLGMQPDSLLAA